LSGPAIPAQQVVAVDRLDAAGALAKTVQVPEEQLLVPIAPEEPFPYDEDFPPPQSYKKLGILIGFAFLGAVALLVFVIFRAATQDDGVRGQPSLRVKARHVAELPRSDDELAPKKRRLAPRWR